jgi:small GTP-binding protein
MMRVITAAGCLRDGSPCWSPFRPDKLPQRLFHDRMMNMTTIQKKICLLGDFGVGKTSLVNRFVEGRFDDKYLSTMGVKISRKTLTRSYGKMNMLVWDLAGGNGFEASASTYMQGATGALIICDLTRRDTLAACENYARQIRTMNLGVQLVFVGNKADMDGERVVSVPDMLAALSVFGERTFFLTSAKTGEQVEETFTYLAEKIEGGT